MSTLETVLVVLVVFACGFFTAKGLEHKPVQCLSGLLARQ